MPQGKGTYGTKVGRPPKKKKVLRMNKGGTNPSKGKDAWKGLSQAEKVRIFLANIKAGKGPNDKLDMSLGRSTPKKK